MRDAIGLAKVSLKLPTFLVEGITGLPVAKQTGVTTQFKQLFVSTAPRFWFSRCLVENFPLALPELEGISLYLNAENGLASRSWNYTKWMCKEMFNFIKGLNLSDTDLALLDYQLDTIQRPELTSCIYYRRTATYEGMWLVIGENLM